MTTDQIDLVTLFVFLGPLFIWVPWELVLLVLRAKARREGKPLPRLISQVALRVGYKVPSVPFLWSGLGVHYWFNRETYALAWAGVLFWLTPVLLAIYVRARAWSEPTTWPRWKRVALHPILWLALGAPAGYFLFPQTFPW